MGSETFSEERGLKAFGRGSDRLSDVLSSLSHHLSYQIKHLSGQFCSADMPHLKRLIGHHSFKVKVRQPRISASFSLPRMFLPRAMALRNHANASRTNHRCLQRRQPDHHHAGDVETQRRIVARFFLKFAFQKVPSFGGTPPKLQKNTFRKFAKCLNCLLPKCCVFDILFKFFQNLQFFFFNYLLLVSS